MENIQLLEDEKQFKNEPILTVQSILHNSFKSVGIIKAKTAIHNSSENKNYTDRLWRNNKSQIPIYKWKSNTNLKSQPKADMESCGDTNKNLRKWNSCLDIKTDTGSKVKNIVLQMEMNNNQNQSPGTRMFMEREQQLFLELQEAKDRSELYEFRMLELEEDLSKVSAIKVCENCSNLNMSQSNHQQDACFDSGCNSIITNYCTSENFEFSEDHNSAEDSSSVFFQLKSNKDHQNVSNCGTHHNMNLEEKKTNSEFEILPKSFLLQSMKTNSTSSGVSSDLSDDEFSPTGCSTDDPLLKISNHNNETFTNSNRSRGEMKNELNYEIEKLRKIMLENYSVENKGLKNLEEEVFCCDFLELKEDYKKLLCQKLSLESQVKIYQEQINERKNELEKIDDIPKKLEHLEDTKLELMNQLNNWEHKYNILKNKNESLNDDYCELEEAENDNRLNSQRWQKQYEITMDNLKQVKIEYMLEHDANEMLEKELQYLRDQETAHQNEVVHLESLIQRQEQHIFDLEEVEVELNEKLLLLEKALVIMYWWNRMCMSTGKKLVSYPAITSKANYKNNKKSFELSSDEAQANLNSNQDHEEQKCFNSCWPNNKNINQTSCNQNNSTKCPPNQHMNELKSSRVSFNANVSKIHLQMQQQNSSDLTQKEKNLLHRNNQLDMLKSVSFSKSLSGIHQTESHHCSLTPPETILVGECNIGNQSVTANSNSRQEETFGKNQKFPYMKTKPECHVKTSEISSVITGNGCYLSKRDHNGRHSLSLSIC